MKKRKSTKPRVPPKIDYPEKEKLIYAFAKDYVMKLLTDLEPRVVMTTFANLYGVDFGDQLDWYANQFGGIFAEELGRELSRDSSACLAFDRTPLDRCGVGTDILDTAALAAVREMASYYFLDQARGAIGPWPASNWLDVLVAKLQAGVGGCSHTCPCPLSVRERDKQPQE